MNEKSLLLDPTAAVQEAHNDLIANGTIAVVSAGRVARASQRRRQDARVRVLRPARQSVHFVTGAPRLSRITSRRGRGPPARTARTSQSARTPWVRGGAGGERG